MIEGKKYYFNEVDLPSKLIWMKYTFFTALLLFTFSFLSTSAQQNHFIYFQTENKQPFYIKLDNKIFTSPSSGYLILPKLKNGNYSIKFGSTKNEWPEQTVNYKLEKDAGFIFKNFGEKGWGLFNLQSLDIIMAGNDMSKKAPAQEIKDDDFSKMLANVVNDPTIKEKDIVLKDEVKEAPDENVATQAETITAEASPEEIDAPILNSVIKRNLKIKNKDGMELVYTDEYDNKKDTIRIFIPNEKYKKKQKKAADATVEVADAIGSNQIMPPTVNVETNNETDTAENTRSLSISDQPLEQEKKGTTKNIDQDTSLPIIKDTSQSIAKENKTVKEDNIEFLPAQSGKINPDCKGYANEDDFLRLRRKMVAENNEEDMIKVAKKVFKTKCFTTEYVKNLSTLFLQDEGKYNFFDAAYSYVSDTGVFVTLENQLSDTYYIKRFKAMIHQ